MSVALQQEASYVSIYNAEDSPYLISNEQPRTPPALVHMTDESPWKDICVYCTEQYKQEKDRQSHIWYYHRLRRMAFPHTLNFKQASEDVIHQTSHHTADNGSGYYIPRVMHAEIHSAVRM